MTSGIVHPVYSKEDFTLVHWKVIESRKYAVAVSRNDDGSFYCPCRAKGDRHECLHVLLVRLYLGEIRLQ